MLNCQCVRSLMERCSAPAANEGVLGFTEGRESAQGMCNPCRLSYAQLAVQLTEIAVQTESPLDFRTSHTQLSKHSQPTMLCFSSNLSGCGKKSCVLTAMISSERKEITRRKIDAGMRGPFFCLYYSISKLKLKNTLFNTRRLSRR